MLVEEASWLAEVFARTPDASLFPLLNLGSSTAAFRTVEQPFIQRDVFDPLARRGGRVVHVDVKPDVGVDVVGDVTSPAFASRLNDDVQARAILISNLLEHVTDCTLIAQRVLDLLPAGGLIFVSGPRNYPHHPDPIDNGFRPSVAEVHALFPRTLVLESRVLIGHTWRPWTGVAPSRYLARLGVPVYRPKSWWRAAVRLSYWWRSVSAYAVVLSKPRPEAES